MSDPTPKHGERQRFKISAPIASGDGKQIKSLSVREPLLQDRAAAEHEHPNSQASQSIFLLARLGGIDEDVAKKIKTRDARRIQKWITGLAVADKADTVAELEGRRTFGLLVPVPTDGDDVTSLDVREPDLEAAILAEKFTDESDRAAATIAHLAGTTIPIIKRLACRDVDRIEAWLLPFLMGEVDDPNETDLMAEEVGAT